MDGAVTEGEAYTGVRQKQREEIEEPTVDLSSFVLHDVDADATLSTWQLETLSNPRQQNNPS